MSTSKTVLSLFTALVFWLSSSVIAYEQSAYEAQGWKLKKYHRRTDTSIFLKDTEDSDIKTFLGVTVIDTDLPTLVSIFNDHDNMTEWVYNMDYQEIVERVSETELYQYVVFGAPYPVNDRDLVVHTVVTQNEKNGVIEINSNMVEDKVDEKDGMVRMNDGNNLFRFTPLPDDKVLVEFRFFGDPAGFIPSWAVNLMASGAPYYTLKKMHRTVRKREYRDDDSFNHYAWPREDARGNEETREVSGKAERRR